MHTKNEYIAVLDSGVGGISVLKELIRLMPNEQYLYFGDSANAPYGNRSAQQVRELTLSAAEMLLSRGAKALVVACNTATAVAIEDLRQAHPDTVIVGIEPALKVASDRYPTGHIGVMATPITLREEKFHHQLERFPGLEVTTLEVPGLVELIEAGHTDDKALEDCLAPVLLPYKNKLDAVVLGCTHYPFAKTVISRLLGEKTPLLDGGEGTARQTYRRLYEQGLLSDGPGQVQIENSSGSPRLTQLCITLLED